MIAYERDDCNTQNIDCSHSGPKAGEKSGTQLGVYISLSYEDIVTLRVLRRFIIGLLLCQSIGVFHFLFSSIVSPRGTIFLTLIP